MDIKNSLYKGVVDGKVLIEEIKGDLKMEALLERFIRYAKIDTRSDSSSDTIPSTQNQVAFLTMLEKELLDLGFDEVTYHKNSGFLIGKVNGNTQAKAIGLIAHVDTADFESRNVKPKVIYHYDGADIALNETYVLSPKDFPNLSNYVGKTLITTSGDTLLGADDKAGLAEIIEACKYFIEHKEEKHGDIYVAFGPDEEIGTGADYFPIDTFPVDFAYTLDGSVLGELEYESFNAAAAEIIFKGVAVHPGTAKNKMINANKLVIEFDNYLPKLSVPEHTEGYEGFFMLYDIEANLEYAKVSYIIRDHDRNLFEQRKKYLEHIVDMMNEKYGQRVEMSLKDQYYNMREVIEKDMTCVELAIKSMKKLGIEPIVKAIRGGTDGSKISFMGIPTPNIFTGGENYHGRYEFACLEVMNQAKETIIQIIKENTYLK